MFKEKYRPYLRWGVTILLIIICSFLCFFAMLRFDQFKGTFAWVGEILQPVTIGLAIAYIISPMTGWFERRFLRLFKIKKARHKGVRGAAIAVSVVILLVIIGVIIGTVIPQTIDSVGMLLANLDGYVNSLVGWISPRLQDMGPSIETYLRDAMEDMERNITAFLQNDLLRFLGSATARIMEVGKTIYNFVMGLIVSIYTLSARDRLIGRVKKLTYAFLTPAWGNRVLGVSRETDQLFRGFISGKLLSGMIVGVICFVGMSIMRMPYTLLISVIIGVTDLIPYFGPFIGAVPSALLILMIDPMQCLIFVIFILVLQQIEGNVIGPKVLGNTTGLSSFGVLLSILLGGGFFGLMGMIVAVPAFGVIYSLGKRFVDRRLKERKLPEETSDYVKLEGVDPETMIPGYPPGDKPE